MQVHIISVCVHDRQNYNLFSTGANELAKSQGRHPDLVILARLIIILEINKVLFKYCLTEQLIVLHWFTLTEQNPSHYEEHKVV